MYLSLVVIDSFALEDRVYHSTTRRGANAYAMMVWYGVVWNILYRGYESCIKCGKRCNGEMRVLACKGEKKGLNF